MSSGAYSQGLGVDTHSDLRMRRGGGVPAAARAEGPAAELAITEQQQHQQQQDMKKRTKRTWDGVFLPVSVSVFGVVLFIRLPWIVGQAGLLMALLAIALCYLASGLTTISMAAISTNGHVGDGGPYMMISRCLGPQVGTVIGITFVLANAVSSGMYLLGSADIIVQILPWAALEAWQQEERYLVTLLVASSMLMLLLLIAFLSVEKQFRVICILLTLVSIIDIVVAMASEQPNAAIGFTGPSKESWENNLGPDFVGKGDTTVNFQTIVSVLFPGVTGVMSGVCVSGELVHTAKAIPRGIGYAWATSLAIYTAVTFIIAASFNRVYLRSNFGILNSVGHPWFFYPGEAVACFAAVLAMLGGSIRVLQAMAKDDLMRSYLLRLVGASTTRNATIFYGLAVQLILFAGDTYQPVSLVAAQIYCCNFAALNLSTFVSSASGVVSFRPTYRFFNKTTALLGALFNIGLMFFMNPVSALGFFVCIVALVVFIDRALDTSAIPWGDASQPLVFHIVRKWLLRLDARREHVRHWRPSILLLCTDPLCSLNLIHLSNSLKKGGLFEIAFVLKGSFEATAAACGRWKGWAMDFIGASSLKAFAAVTFGESLRAGAQGLLRTCGLGGMRPNTVIVSLDELLLGDAYRDVYKQFANAVEDRSLEARRRRGGGAGGGINSGRGEDFVDGIDPSLADGSGGAFLGGGHSSGSGGALRDSRGVEVRSPSTNVGFGRRGEPSVCGAAAASFSPLYSPSSHSSAQEELLSSFDNQLQQGQQQKIRPPPIPPYFQFGRRSRMAAPQKPPSTSTACPANNNNSSSSHYNDECMEDEPEERMTRLQQSYQQRGFTYSPHPLYLRHLRLRLRHRRRQQTNVPGGKSSDGTSRVTIGGPEQQRKNNFSEVAANTAASFFSGVSHFFNRPSSQQQPANSSNRRGPLTSHSHSPVVGDDHDQQQRNSGAAARHSHHSDSRVSVAIRDALQRSSIVMPRGAIEASGQLFFSSRHRPSQSSSTLSSIGGGSRLSSPTTIRAAGAGGGGRGSAFSPIGGGSNGHHEQYEELMMTMGVRQSYAHVYVEDVYCYSTEDEGDNGSSAAARRSSSGRRAGADRHNTFSSNSGGSDAFSSGSAHTSTAFGLAAASTTSAAFGLDGYRTARQRGVGGSHRNDSGNTSQSTTASMGWGWGLGFGGGGGGGGRESEGEEQQDGSRRTRGGSRKKRRDNDEEHQIEKMVLHRSKAMAANDRAAVAESTSPNDPNHGPSSSSSVIDLAAFASIEEFCNVCADINHIQMNLVIARNMDRLDKAAIAAGTVSFGGSSSSSSRSNKKKNNKKKKVFIDLWLPDEHDAVIFLMGYSLSRTSVWLDNAELRVVSVVPREADVEAQNEAMAEILKRHRIDALTHTVSLEAEAHRRRLQLLREGREGGGVALDDSNVSEDDPSDDDGGEVEEVAHGSGANNNKKHNKISNTDNEEGEDDAAAAVERLLANETTRSEALNSIMRSETAHNTAIILCRVDPYRRYRGQSNKRRQQQQQQQQQESQQRSAGDDVGGLRSAVADFGGGTDEETVDPSAPLIRVATRNSSIESEEDEGAAIDAEDSDREEEDPFHPLQQTDSLSGMGGLGRLMAKVGATEGEAQRAEAPLLSSTPLGGAGKRREAKRGVNFADAVAVVGGGKREAGVCSSAPNSPSNGEAAEGGEGGDDYNDEAVRMREWFASIVALSSDLPPMLMIAGGPMRGRDSDW